MFVSISRLHDCADAAAMMWAAARKIEENIWIDSINEIWNEEDEYLNNVDDCTTLLYLQCGDQNVVRLNCRNYDDSEVPRKTSIRSFTLKLRMQDILYGYSWGFSAM